VCVSLPPRPGRRTARKHEKTEWHNVVFFGKLGEIVGEHLKKGSLVYVEGHLQTRSWEKDGENRYTTEIVAEAMKMLPGGKAKAESDTGKGQGKSQQPRDDGPF